MRDDIYCMRFLPSKIGLPPKYANAAGGTIYRRNQGGSRVTCRADSSNTQGSPIPKKIPIVLTETGAGSDRS